MLVAVRELGIGPFVMWCPSLPRGKDVSELPERCQYVYFVYSNSVQDVKVLVFGVIGSLDDVCDPVEDRVVAG